MNLKKHFIVCMVTVLAWFAFYMMGLPFNYYTNWSLGEKMLIVWIGFFSILPFFCIIINIFLGGDYFKNSLWIAFYASVVLFLLDFIVVGLVEKKGIQFLLTHWYLTIGYFEALIVMPLVGYCMKRYNRM